MAKPKELKFETPKAISDPSPKVTPVLTPKHVAVIEADHDEDGVIDSNDQCSDTPKGYSVDKNGCPVQLTLHINFATYSDVIPKSSFTEIDELVKFMKANKYYTIDINGHTDSTGEVGPNQVLSEKRAISLRKVLIDSGISESRMLAKGYGEIQPIVSNMESGGRAQNRRTEVIMHANGGKK